MQRAWKALILVMAWSAAGALAENDPIDLRLLESGTDASLRGIAARGDDVWISGSGGTVRHSADGGATWRSAAPPDTAELDFRDVAILGPQTLLLMSVGNGAASRIYKTTDGGESWRVVLQKEEEAAFFNGLAFWDDTTGLLTSDPIDGRPLLFKTADGGDSWQRVGREAPSLLEGEYGFAASGTLIATASPKNAWLATGGAAARVFRSTDAGATWEVHPTPMRHGTSSSGTFSIAFRDARRGVIVGGDYQQPELHEDNVFRTDDGGVTWSAARTDAAGMPQKACAVHLGGGRYLAVGRTGLAFSADDGHSWTTFSQEPFYTAAFDAASGTGYLAGAEGRVARFRQR